MPAEVKVRSVGMNQQNAKSLLISLIYFLSQFRQYYNNPVQFNVTKLMQIEIICNLRMANRKSSTNNINNSASSLLVINPKCRASPSRSKVLISPSKQLLYFFHKSDMFNMKSLQPKCQTKLKISSKKQQRKQNTQEMSFYQKYKREKSKSKESIKREIRMSQSLDTKSLKYHSLNSSQIDKTSQEYMKKLRCQISQIRKKYGKNQHLNKQNRRLSTTDSCDSGASQICTKQNNKMIKKPCSIPETTYGSYPITPIKKIGFKNPMSSAFKNERKQKLKLVYNPTEKVKLNFDRKYSRQTQAEQHEEQKISSLLQNTKLFQFTFGNMALMDYPHSMINSVQC